MVCTTEWWRRAWALTLVTTLLAACYSYTPMATAPGPATRLALVLNDQGRVGAAPQVGASATRIEGAVIDVSDSTYVLRVAEVRTLLGSRTRWRGEQVAIRRDYVSAAMERRFSPGRSVALALAVGATFVALVASRTLSVLGLGGGDEDKPPPDGQQ